MSAALAGGSVVAGYRIERLLGRGGMGEVWLAHDPSLDRPVALKLVTAAFASDPELRLRFLEETRLAASLDHPHIVPIYGAGEADDHRLIPSCSATWAAGRPPPGRSEADDRSRSDGPWDVPRESPAWLRAQYPNSAAGLSAVNNVCGDYI
jgi:serine/threonine protein kinase